ncbi:MAG TPA: Hsp20/alpha crystallin family protein [Vicinamibacterales bacterium]|nr:Hsp20/alpha crystallin family protein [Vicinamibacterales bacterium]
MAWDPFHDLRDWQERLERLASHHGASWAPSVDVYETADRYVVTAEVPGLAREQIDLALEDSRLTIRGERLGRPATATEARHYHQVERGHGAFARTFEFAHVIQVDAVTADLHNGVLTITLPKKPAAPVRRIEVQ